MYMCIPVPPGQVSLLPAVFLPPRQEVYILQITAMDLGSPRLTATAQIPVRVTKTDFNDYDPEFLGDTIFRVPEEVSVGTVVGTLTVTDEDLGQAEEVTLRIESAKPGMELWMAGTASVVRKEEPK